MASFGDNHCDVSISYDKRYVHPVLHEEDAASVTRSARPLHPAIQPAVEYLKAYRAEHHCHPFGNNNQLVGAGHILSICAKLVRR